MHYLQIFRFWHTVPVVCWRPIYCMMSYWNIIQYDLHPSNSLHDIRQNHWPMKYRSLTYLNFMKSIFVSHWPIIPNLKFHPSNSLRDTRQNHSTMKYRSLWPPYDKTVNKTWFKWQNLFSWVQHRKPHEKIPTCFKVMTILANIQISWNMKNLILL